MNRVVQYRVSSIISEMGLHSPVSLVDDFDPAFSIRNYGLYRLYEFHLEIRDDFDSMDFLMEFCSILEQENKINNIKIDAVEINEYPGPAMNWHTAYLTVAVI